MREIKLKPCPFCGGEDLGIVAGRSCNYVRCRKCETKVVIAGYGMSERDVAEFWNDRADSKDNIS